MDSKFILKQFFFLLLSFECLISYGQAYPDRHSNILSDSWLSNVKTASPNASRGVIHWIRYDLGDSYSLHKSKFWNINHPDYLNAGARKIVIDYSLNGTTWFEWGRYELSASNGSTFYEGEAGPDFSGLVARYVLINIVDNHGHPTISGLSEVKINVAPVTTYVDDKIFDGVNIVAAPNPFSSVTNISIENAESLIGNSNYQISDNAGRLIQTSKLTSNITFDASNLQSGVYKFSIINASGIKSIQLTVVK